MRPSAPWLAALLLVAGAARLAAAVPASPLGNVSDFAGALDAATEDRLRRAIEQVAARDVALAVAVVDRTDPETPKMWATEAFNQWGVGEEGSDNGVLVVLATGNRRVEVETGYGVEHRLTDAQVGRLLDRHAVPFFRRNDWSGGLVALVEGIADHLEPRATPPRRTRPSRSLPSRPSRSRSRHGGGGFLGVLLGLLAFLTTAANLPMLIGGAWMIWALSFPVRHIFVDRRFWLAGLVSLLAMIATQSGIPGAKDWAIFPYIAWILGVLFGLQTLARRCPRCKVGYTDVTYRTLRSASYYSSGRGQKTVDCPSCPFHSVSTYTIPRRTRSTSSSSSSWSSGSSSYSSSSFSSFGGGSSGGGGAGRSF